VELSWNPSAVLSPSLFSRDISWGLLMNKVGSKKQIAKGRCFHGITALSRRSQMPRQGAAFDDQATAETCRRKRRTVAH